MVHESDWILQNDGLDILLSSEFLSNLTKHKVSLCNALKSQGITLNGMDSKASDPKHADLHCHFLLLVSSSNLPKFEAVKSM